MSVGGEAALCASCWGQVQFIAEPMCASCGMPFEFEVEPGAVCGVCAATDRPTRRQRAVVAYDDGSRGLILAFKRSDRTDAAGTFGAWMVRAGGVLLEDRPLLVPVPLHWTRLFSRRYNQAAMLALAVARRADADVAVDALVRRKRTPKLGTSGPQARAETVRGAFAVARRWRKRIDGRTILLIDDVYTTGSTTNACARALRQAGAGPIDVLTLARVVRPTVAAAAGRPRPPVASNPTRKGAPE